MNAFSPFDLSPHAQMTLPQTAASLQQPNQTPSLTSTNLVGSQSGSLFAALFAGVWVAAVFFHIGMKAGQRQSRYHDRPAAQRQDIQTLERIWQLSAKRKD